MKTVVIVYDANHIAKSEMDKLAHALYQCSNIGAHVVQAYELPDRFKLFDMSSLPAAEIQEIRKLIEEKVTVSTGLGV